ncbi:MAG: DUF3347 domain-containing protein [Bacteroidia bacterium]|nr:DUF3347 domain-containing protein [Bacteroidia bacterium]
MKTILLTALAVITAITSQAQIKNAKTETYKVQGNCSMCKTKIEKAATIKKQSLGVWNEDTKLLTLTYNSMKTSGDEVLKRIALVGYDNEKFLAPDNAYANLHGCCQYERTGKITSKPDIVKNPNPVITTIGQTSNEVAQEQGKIATKVEVQTKTSVAIQPLKKVMDNYFALKNALVTDNSKEATTISASLLVALKEVNMSDLKNDVNIVWMSSKDNLIKDAQQITNAKNIDAQRKQLSSLSKSIYALLKVDKQSFPVYYNYCPMYNNGKGANWLSTEASIKNPYFGAQMIGCGKTVETIK